MGISSLFNKGLNSLEVTAKKVIKNADVNSAQQKIKTHSQPSRDVFEKISSSLDDIANASEPKVAVTSEQEIVLNEAAIQRVQDTVSEYDKILKGIRQSESVGEDVFAIKASHRKSAAALKKERLRKKQEGNITSNSLPPFLQDANIQTEQLRALSEKRQSATKEVFSQIQHDKFTLEDAQRHREAMRGEVERIKTSGFSAQKEKVDLDEDLIALHKKITGKDSN